MKKVRATLAQDNYMMLSKMLDICRHLFTADLDADAANATLKLLRGVTDGLCVIKSSKTLCEFECKEDNIHACYLLYLMAMDIANQMLQNGIDITSIDQFSKIIRSNFTLVGKMTCKRATNLQACTMFVCKNLLKACDTKSKAIMITPIVVEMLKKVGPLPSNMQMFNKVQLLRMLWYLHQTAEDRMKMIEVGFLILAFHREFDADYFAILEHIICYTVKYVKEIIVDKPISVPHEYLTKELYAAYNLKQPADFDPIEMACFFFKNSYLTGNDEYYEKYVNSMIKYAASKKYAQKSAHFLHFIISVPFDKETNDLVEKMLKTLKTHITKTKSPSVTLLLGKILFLQYSSMVKDFTQKHKHVQTIVEFTDQGLTSPDCVFRQMNFDMEMNQFERLRFIKKTYTDFIDFYLASTPDEREQYADEKCNILTTTKLIANQLMLRGYLEHGLKLYWKLYQFSAAANDDHTMIESGAYLAEYSTEFKLLNPNDDLNATLDTCSDLVKEKLKTFDKLGFRKQTIVLNYLLSLIVFMCENKRADDQKVMHLLIFVVGMVGGVDDELISSIYGIDVDVKTVPNQAFDGIRFKIYATVFAMITKYNVKYPYNPHLLMEHMLRFLKANAGILMETTYAVTITGIKTISMIVSFCQSHYVATQYESMLLTMLKIVLRFGFVRSLAEMVYFKILLELSSEKFASCLVGLGEG